MDVLAMGASLDEVTVPWVFYALKESPLRLYMRGSRVRFARGGDVLAPGAPAPPLALLPAADFAVGLARLRTPEFALVDLQGVTATPVIEDIDSPNRIEAWGTWLGTRPITICVLGPPGFAATLSFEAAPGPSLPGTPRRTLLLQAGDRV